MAIEISADVVLNMKNGLINQLQEAFNQMQSYADSNKINVGVNFDKNTLNKIAAIFKQNKGSLDKVFDSKQSVAEITKILNTIDTLKSKINNVNKTGATNAVNVKSLEKELTKQQTALAKIGLNFAKDNMNRLIAPVEIEPVLSKDFKSKAEAELAKVKLTKEVELVAVPSKNFQNQVNNIIQSSGQQTSKPNNRNAGKQTGTQNGTSKNITDVKTTTQNIEKITTAEMKEIEQQVRSGLMASGRVTKSMAPNISVDDKGLIKISATIKETTGELKVLTETYKNATTAIANFNKENSKVATSSKLQGKVIKTTKNNIAKTVNTSQNSVTQAQSAKRITENDFLTKQASIISHVNKKLESKGYTPLGSQTTVSFEQGLVKVATKIKDADGAWQSFSAKVDADLNILSPKFKAINKNVSQLEQELLMSPAAISTNKKDKRLNTREMKAVEREVYSGLLSSGRVKDSMRPSISVDDNGLIKITATIKDADNQTKTLTETYKSATAAIENFNKASSKAAISSKWQAKIAKNKSDKDKATKDPLITSPTPRQDDNLKNTGNEANKTQTALNSVNQALSVFNKESKVGNYFPAELAKYTNSLNVLQQEFKEGTLSEQEFKQESTRLINELNRLKTISNKNLVGNGIYEKTNWQAAAMNDLAGRGTAMGKASVTQMASGSEKLTQKVKALNGEVQRVTYTWDKNTNALTRQTTTLGKAETVFSTIGSKWKQLMTYWTTMYMNPFTAVSKITEAVKVIQGLDDALVDLRKTSKMTSGELNEFYLDANETAKKMGVTTKGIIEQAAAWSRLGYNSKDDATRMAELSSQFAIISPDMELEKAQTGLVSTMKAFNIDVNDVKDDIMSAINVVGNNFATSNGQIIDGLERSASAMAASGATLKETISIFTGAQEIVQNSESVGSAMKSFSMRIRGMDEEGNYDDELGDVTGDVNRLTGGKVRIMEDANTYRSVYDILKDIAGVWDQITDKNRAELLEKLFAKTRANTGAAILSNFSAVEESMRMMEDSAGSADRELAIAQESISYNLNKLKEEWVGIGQDTLTRDFLKGAIEALTAISQLIGGIIKTVGPMGTIGGVLGLFLAGKNKGRVKSCLSLNMPLAV